MNLNNVFINSSEQEILDFLAQNPNRFFFDKEISKKTGISRGATNQILNRLPKTGLVIKEKKGRMNFYKINILNPIIIQFKIFRNVIALSQIIKKLQPLAKKIILFGSVSRGEDDLKSDIDLFILTHNPEEVRKIIKKSKIGKRKIQLITRTPANWFETEKKDPVFFNEVQWGITLWEKNE